MSWPVHHRHDRVLALEWITPPLVVSCMVGVAIPDRNRVDLLVPADTITALTGFPW